MSTNILRRGLPAELLVEIFECLKVGYGIGILMAIPSVLIVRCNGPKYKKQLDKLLNKVGHKFEEK